MLFNHDSLYMNEKFQLTRRFSCIAWIVQNCSSKFVFIVCSFHRWTWVSQEYRVKHLIKNVYVSLKLDSIQDDLVWICTFYCHYVVLFSCWSRTSWSRFSVKCVNALKKMRLVDCENCLSLMYQSKKRNFLWLWLSDAFKSSNKSSLFFTWSKKLKNRFSTRNFTYILQKNLKTWYSFSLSTLNLRNHALTSKWSRDIVDCKWKDTKMKNLAHYMTSFTSTWILIKICYYLCLQFVARCFHWVVLVWSIHFQISSIKETSFYAFWQLIHCAAFEVSSIDWYK